MAVYVVLHRHIHIGSHQYKVRANGGLETMNMEEGMVKKEKREKTNRKEMGKHHTWGGKKRETTVSMVTGRGTVLVVACETGS